MNFFHLKIVASFQIINVYCSSSGYKIFWYNIVVIFVTKEPRLGVAINIRMYVCMYVYIHQIFSLAHDWSKHVTWPNITQLKLGDIQEYPPIFKTARVVKKIWRILDTIASIWGKNMLRYLSLDIICSSKLTVFLEPRSQKTVRFSEQIMSTDKYPSMLIIFCAKCRLLFIYNLCQWQSENILCLLNI